MRSGVICWSLLGLLSCAACNSPVPSVLGYPSWPAKSWVFGLEQAQDPQVLLHADERAEAAIRWEAASGKARLHAFAYEVSLAELGLQAGAIPAANDCERPCALTRPAHHFVLDYDVDHASSWTEATTPGTAVLDVLVPDRHQRCREGCLTFTSTHTQLDVDTRTVFLLPELPRVGDEGSFHSALLGLADGAIYRVFGPGSVVRLCRGGSYVPTAAALDLQRGRVWAATSELEIGSLDLAALEPEQPCPFVRTATGAPGPTIIRMAFSAREGGVLVLSSTGALARVNGPRVKRLGFVALRNTEAVSVDGFLIEHNGLAYAAVSGDEIVTIRGDELSGQRGFSLGAKVTQAMSALTYDGEVYAGLLSYNLFILGAGRFEPLDEGARRISATWNDPASLAGFQGSILASLNHGFVGEWSRATSYCQIQGPFNPEGARLALNLGGLLFSADGDHVVPSRPRSLLWLVPSRSEICAVGP